MANAYYNHSTGQPTARSRGSSEAIRAEFDEIAAAFTKVDEAIGDTAALGAFSQLYQGAAATDPTQRKDGTRLQDGDLYFNSVSKVLKVFGGGLWNAVPTTSSVITKDGGTLTGALKGTSAEFSGALTAAALRGDISAATGLTSAQVTAALGYTPADLAGAAFTGAITGTNITLTGTLEAQTVRELSDERFKRGWKRVSDGFIEALAGIKKAGVFFWKQQDIADCGVSAQDLREVLPEAVAENEHGALTVAYGNAALVGVIELAREVLRLRREIEALKKAGGKQ